MISVSSCEFFGEVGVSVEVGAVRMSASEVFGGVNIAGSFGDVKLWDNTIRGGISAASGSPFMVWIVDNWVVVAETGIHIDTTAFQWQIQGNIISTISGDGIRIEGATGVVVKNNTIVEPFDYGILLVGDDCDIGGNRIVDPSSDVPDATDGIFVDGDRNHVHENRVLPGVVQPRYGINVSAGDCNVVVGNVLGDPADYGTDALTDAGTNTQLVYPNDPMYGDNFTVCGS